MTRSFLQNREDLSRYVPPSTVTWKGREDGGDYAYIHQSVHCTDLSQQELNFQKGSFGIVGLCSDEGVRRNMGRIGAAEGPNSLRECLSKLPITSKDPFTIYDCGDVNCSDSDLALSQKTLGRVVSGLLQQNVHPIIIGGGHEVAWGTYQGLASAFPKANIGIINFDAHYDLRPLVDGVKGSSGTPFHQIAMDRLEKELDFNYMCIGIQRYGNSKSLFERAKELEVTTIYADEMFSHQADTNLQIVRSFLLKCDIIYLTICLDVFEAPICPGVSAPQVLGLTPWQVIPIMREVIASKKTLCMDIAELSPPHDIDMRTAKLAASLVCEYLHGVNLYPS
ncbi:MAG: formimidoylglutamase [Chlamydiota bacterium]